MSVTPIIEPNRRQTVFGLKDIWTGPNGTGRYVPNLDDGVFDWMTGLFRVTYVDPTTHLSTLVGWTINHLNGGIMQSDVLLGGGPTPISNAWRVYINNAHTPPTLSFDSNLYLRGQNASYVKVFKGTDITNTGHVISAVFNAGILVSENIPLVLLTMPDNNNIAIKTPAIGSSIEQMNDDDTVTTVLYSSNGAVLGIYGMVVKITDFVKTTDTSKRYVVAIELVSPYLSLTDNTLLEYPVNMLLQAAGLRAKVTYDDGSFELLPIDDNRFSLAGLDRYINNIPDVKANLVLVYKLGANEYGYNVSAPNPDRVLTKRYRLMMREAEPIYDVKLFAAPYWDVTGQTPIWKLRWYLYRLTRDQVIDVTDFVVYDNINGSFNGALYNTIQKVIVSLNLSLASSEYLYYNYVQSFQINLLQSGGDATGTSYYEMMYEADSWFGGDSYVTYELDPTDGTKKRILLNMGMVDKTEWLNRYYKPTKPLKALLEVDPPVPTHVRLVINETYLREITIDEALDWVLGIDTALNQGQLIALQFIQRTPDQDYELSLNSFILRHS